jgi:hypothetical protein
MYPETNVPAFGTPKVLITVPVKSNLSRVACADAWLANTKVRRRTQLPLMNVVDILLVLLIAFSCLQSRAMADNEEDFIRRAGGPFFFACE